MDFNKTEEQELLLSSLRELVNRHLPDDYMRKCDEEHREHSEFYKILVDNGFGLLGLPEKYGGTEVDTTTLILVAEELAALDAPTMCDKMLQADDILEFGSEEQKKIILDLIKQGKQAFSIGISEPQAGSDNNAIATTATRRNGKVYINGHKTFCTNADRSPYMLCLTRDLESNKPPAQSISMWLLPMDRPGVRLEPLHKLGMGYTSTFEVYLDDVAIEEKDLIGKENMGWLNLMKNLETERILTAAQCLGAAQCCFNDAVKYANQRVQFEKTIGSFQLIQEKLTYMKIKLENMRNMVYKCAWEKDNGQSIKLSSSLCKLYCAQSAFEVADDAVQIFGGIGYTLDCRVSRLWRDLRVYRIFGGTDQIQIHVAGREILRQAAKAM
ncbi:MAG: acyl-CoA dehydrogenase [Gracilibacteraceae bacterium]|jgi:alkylation response protein AidB-like acyl-CoA dehydrogenase|nr:acyl-CoA dehydrogenase [Gracilibacteraceae bacterium]